MAISKDRKKVSFGQGNVGLRAEGNKLELSNTKPGLVGRNSSREKGSKRPLIAMDFNSAESVDVVIEMLERVKENINKEKQ